MASGLFFIWVQNTTPGDCGATTSSVSITAGRPSTASGSGGVTSVIADPRIGNGQQEIGDQVADNEDERRHQHRTHHEVLVLLQDGIERDASQTRPGKNYFDDEGAGDEG